MKPTFKIKIILSLILSLTLLQCRNDELKVIDTYSALSNPTYALIYYILPGVLSTTSSGGSGTVPRGFKSSGGSLFAVGNSLSLYESTDGNTFTKKTFTLPNCTAVNGNSNGSTYTDCNIVSVAKSGSTIYALALKQSGIRGENFSLSSVTDHKFYFASGATVNDLSFVEISESNLSSTYYQASNTLFSAASSNGFVFSFGTSSTTHKYCGTGNNGSSWVCANGVATNTSSGGVIDLLNGILVADIYYRWNGSGFTSAVTSNGGTKGSIIYSSGRTIYSSGSAIRYTATDPSTWAGANVTGETTATQSGAPTGSYNWIGNFSGILKAIGSSSSSNPTTYTAHSSSDNGSTWSSQGTISLPSGLSPSQQIGSLNNTVFVYGSTTSGTSTQKYFKSTDFTNWTEVVP
ncbi:MAG: hypothetical protein SH817_19190 [Leptospira sp.]|nr:hypothetical protein [Leptospira sp.]